MKTTSPRAEQEARGEDGGAPGDGNFVRSVYRATEVLFCLAEERAPMGPSEISRRIGLDRATVYRLLQTFAARDLVIPSGDSGRYVLGPGLLRLSEAIPGNELRELTAPLIGRLRDYSTESVALGIVMQSRSIHVLQAPSPRSIHWNARIGASAPLYAGATGKAMLAFLDAKQQAAAFAEPHLPEFVERAEEAKERARQEIATIRRRGYAVASHELSADVNGIAAPIFDRFGKPVAAITIGGPSSRFDDEAVARNVTPLLETVNELSSRLGYNVMTAHPARR